jgi:hypothetical protein
MNNNASCDNRVLGLLFGPSAGLYGMSKEVPWRFVARCTAVLSRGRHVVKASHCFTQLVAAWRTTPFQCNVHLAPSVAGVGIRSLGITDRRSRLRYSRTTEATNMRVCCATCHAPGREDTEGIGNRWAWAGLLFVSRLCIG